MTRKESRKESAGGRGKQSSKSSAATRAATARNEARNDELDLLRETMLAEEGPSFDGGDIAVKVDDGKLFGLNAVERMFLSIGLFLVVTVLSVFLLILTDSIAIP